MGNEKRAKGEVDEGFDEIGIDEGCYSKSNTLREFTNSTFTIQRNDDDDREEKTRKF